MTLDEAVQEVTSVALMWAENAEEELPRRVQPGDSDETIRGLAEDDEDLLATGIECRDILRAADLILGARRKGVFATESGMKVEHLLEFSCRCPVNQETVDVYQAAFRCSRIVPVEDILAAIAEVTKHPTFQEQITADLAARLSVEVSTVGKHSGVETKCTCF